VQNLHSIGVILPGGTCINRLLLY